MANDIEELEDRFLDALKHHLAGWRAKINRDFSEDSFKNELNQLSSDPLYPKFNFATADYANIRFIGRMSISIGRRLGEIYDKVPRFLAAARFKLTAAQIAPVIAGLELDICLQFASIANASDRQHALDQLRSVFPSTNFSQFSGVGIEIRYNFNPHDSSRLRKDVVMAENLLEGGLFPIYLVFSSISPRDEAIKRLTAAGWNFLVGQTAVDFSSNLLGLDRPTVKATIKNEIDAMMSEMKQSYSFRQFVAEHYDEKTIALLDSLPSVDNGLMQVLSTVPSPDSVHTPGLVTNSKLLK
jgi:hypothetical protein